MIDSSPYIPLFFFCNDTATTEIYTLSLHDALPISIGDATEDQPEKARPGMIRGAAIDVRSSMPGRVVRVLVAPGARVRRGQTLLVLEAMKMQNEIPAPQDGVVRRLNATEGETIPADRVVAVLERR